jgi:hypothetical protein
VEQTEHLAARLSFPAAEVPEPWLKEGERELAFDGPAPDERERRSHVTCDPGADMVPSFPHTGVFGVPQGRRPGTWIAG